MIFQNFSDRPPFDHTTLVLLLTSYMASPDSNVHFWLHKKIVKIVYFVHLWAFLKIPNIGPIGAWIPYSAGYRIVAHFGQIMTPHYRVPSLYKNKRLRSCMFWYTLFHNFIFRWIESILLEPDTSSFQRAHQCFPPKINCILGFWYLGVFPVYVC